MSTDTNDPMANLRSHLETETEAAAQRLTELIVQQGERMEASLRLLEEDWEKRHHEVLLLSEKTVRSATTRLRKPIETSMKEMSGLAQEMAQTIDAAGSRANAHVDRATGQFEKSINKAAQIASEKGNWLLGHVSKSVRDFHHDREMDLIRSGVCLVVGVALGAWTRGFFPG